MIAVLIAWFVSGQPILFDSYATWKKARSARRVDYSEFTDAFFGLDARATYASNSPYGTNYAYSYVPVASFYIGKRKFNFSTKRKPGLIKFLEERIPKGNVDVDEYADSPDAS